MTKRQSKSLLNLPVPLENLEQTQLLLRDLYLLREILGWRLIEELLFLPMVPKRGGKRIRKKKAKRLRERYLLTTLVRTARDGEKWRDKEAVSK